MILSFPEKNKPIVNKDRDEITSPQVAIFWGLIIILQTIVLFNLDGFWEKTANGSDSWSSMYWFLLLLQFFWLGLPIQISFSRYPQTVFRVIFLYYLSSWLGMFGIMFGYPFVLYFSILMYLCISYFYP